MDEERKRALLFPPWAANHNGARYDALSDADKGVWRKTRGQRDDADSELRWLDQLADAMHDGSITWDEMEQAIKRTLDNGTDSR